MRRKTSDIWVCFTIKHFRWYFLSRLDFSGYLITYPDGNIMVDSTRFHPWLVKELEKLGGIEWLFLLHEDDVTSETSGSEKILGGEAPVLLAPELISS